MRTRRWWHPVPPSPFELLVAVAVDLLLGEPPPMLHPVVWMGRCLDWLEGQAPAGNRARVIYGVFIALLLPLAWATAISVVARRLPMVVRGVLLKPGFSGRSLLAAGQRVEQALSRGDLAAGRDGLRWLVSRPTEGLSSELIAAAAIESLAENLVDSWVAPMAWYALGGIGAVYAQRAVNTADAMWGYRDPRYQQLGKGSARLDDLVAWVPARLGAAALAASGGGTKAWRVWQRDGNRTASPNAGQAMAAMAGALDRRLEKVGAYALNASATAPDAADLLSARRLVARAGVLGLGLALVFSTLRRGGAA